MGSRTEQDGKESGSHEHCPFIQRCPMFPEFQSKSVLRVFQIFYCEGDYSNCARYKSASQGVMPAPTLLPDGTSLNDRQLRPSSSG